MLLDHLVASFAALAWTSAVHRFPNPNRRNHLASITFTAAGFVTDAERQRAEAIRKRRTDRLPFRPPAGWDEFSVLLRDVLRDCPVSVDVVPDDARDDLVRASRLAAGLRRYDSMFHAEMQWWITDAASPLGIPANALVTRSEQSRVPLGRAFPTVEHEPRRTGVKLDQSTVLVVSTGRDDELEFVSAGEAVSRILLESTMAGYATCALTHLTEVPECRSIVRDIVGSARKPRRFSSGSERHPKTANLHR